MSVYPSRQVVVARVLSARARGDQETERRALDILHLIDMEEEDQ